MQIFILDRNPVISAKMLFNTDKKRAFKQIIETAQIVSQCAKEYNNFVYNYEDCPCKGLSGNKMPMYWILKHEYNLKWAIDNTCSLLTLFIKSQEYKLTDKSSKYREFFLECLTNGKVTAIQGYYEFITFEPMCKRSFELHLSGNYKRFGANAIIDIHKQIIREKNQ